MLKIYCFRNASIRDENSVVCFFVNSGSIFPTRSFCKSYRGLRHIYVLEGEISVHIDESEERYKLHESFWRLNFSLRLSCNFINLYFSWSDNMSKVLDCSGEEVSLVDLRRDTFRL